MTEDPRTLIAYALDLSTALLDSGRCPDCLHGECDHCDGFGQDADGVECAKCDGHGDAPHLEDCGLVELQRRTYEWIHGVTNVG